MIEALQIAGTGLEAQRRHVEVIADNLANLATPAYRRGRVGFAELLGAGAPSISTAAGVPSREVDASATRGRGVAVESVWRSQESGAMRETGSAWDLAIDGAGFVEVHAEDGRRLYGRAGRLAIDDDGWLGTNTGHRLAADIRIPDDMREIAIDPRGTVGLRADVRQRLQEVGRIELIQFANPERLRAVGQGLFEATDASGPPVVSRAGEAGAGVFRQGHVEGSNVRLVDEFSSLVLAQRAYEASLRVFQTADEMLGLVNNLRR